MCVYIYIYLYIFLFSYYLPSCSITRNWIEFPLLYSRTLLLIHFKCSSLYLLTPNSQSIKPNSFFFSFFLFLNFCLFRATPAAYGGSQDRGPIGAVATSLHHSHSNTGSLTHWVRPGIKPPSSWMLVGFVNCWATMGTPIKPNSWCLKSTYGANRQKNPWQLQNKFYCSEITKTMSTPFLIGSLTQPGFFILKIVILSSFNMKTIQRSLKKYLCGSLRKPSILSNLFFKRVHSWSFKKHPKH